MKVASLENVQQSQYGIPTKVHNQP